MRISELLKQEGREKGREKGREEGREEVAKTLLADGMLVTKVAVLTGLSEERVQELSRLRAMLVS